MNDHAADHDRDALSPWSYQAAPRHESMAEHPLAPMRGVLTGLVLSVPCWALLGALGRPVWGLLR